MIVLPYTTVASVAGSVVLSRIAGLGKPLVASRIPRFASELVSGRDALLVEPGNIDELALAVTRIANDHELARSLGENLRRLSEERSWNRTAALVNLVYQELERQ
jgi:glycosyltransferase involved in cell wall biosynthesis